MMDLDALSPGAKSLLMQPVFRPSRRGAALSATWAENALQCDEEEAHSYIAELVEHHLLEPYQGPNKVPSDLSHFQPAESASLASEQLLRRHKKRREPLINQGAYPLKYLILALCFEDHAFNRRLRNGTMGTAPIFPLIDLYFFLEVPASQVDEAIEELVGAKLLQHNVQRARGHEVRYEDLTARGIRYYEKEVAPKLGLTPNESILDEPPQSLEVFFAWQSENRLARNKLSHAVPQVVKRINEECNLLRELRLVLATEPGEGALRIDVAIEEKIKKSDYFIGDLTPVYAYRNRLRVNENVLIETGFALASKPPGRLILLEMKDPQVDGDDSKTARRAFDIDHVRRTVFESKKDAEDRLFSELSAMLHRDGWILP